MNRNKWFIVNYIALTSVLTLVAAIVLRNLAPQAFPPLLFLIPLFFMLLPGLMAVIRKGCERKGRDRSFFFMTYRAVKMLLALAFILVYFAAVRENLLPFALTFVVFYFALMAFETVHLIKEEKS